MKRSFLLVGSLSILLILFTAFASASDAPMQLAQSGETTAASAAPAPPKIDTGDTTWVLASTALVMLMTPGLALFYGGMVRRKNVLGTIMYSFIMLFMVSVIWVLWGYTLSFGPGKGGIIGGPEWFGLNGVGQEPSPFAPTVPHLLFMMFQGTFAVITPALITGAF